MMMSAIPEYLDDVQRTYATGEAGEHAFRPALRNLLQSLRPRFDALNEPPRNLFGAVDMVVLRQHDEIGWIEAKDVDTPLDKEEGKEQLLRYRGAFPNLLLTDYLEFRWYVDGKLRKKARLASVSGRRLQTSSVEQQETLDLLDGFLTQQVYKVAKPSDLARRMAYLARMAHDAILAELDRGRQGDHLHTQFRAFQTTLRPDLDTAAFADMYAQTIAYGLFAARCNRPTDRDFSRVRAAFDLPPTNPFLQDFFYEGVSQA